MFKQEKIMSFHLFTKITVKNNESNESNESNDNFDLLAARKSTNIVLIIIFIVIDGFLIKYLTNFIDYESGTELPEIFWVTAVSSVVISVIIAMLICYNYFKKEL